MDNVTARGERFATLLGREIRGEATKRGVTAKVLAGLVGIHEVTMSKYLNARIVPPASFIADCTDALGVSAESLVAPAYAALIAELGTLSVDGFMLAASDADSDSEVEAQQNEA